MTRLRLLFRWIRSRKVFLVCLLTFFLYSCGDIKRENPHDPSTNNFEGPRVTITNPINNQTLYTDGFYSGTAKDPQEGIITDSSRYTWKSNIDAGSCKGNNIQLWGILLKSYGKHVITLEVSDDDGNVGRNSINVTIKNY